MDSSPSFMSMLSHSLWARPWLPLEDSPCWWFRVPVRLVGRWSAILINVVWASNPAIAIAVVPVFYVFRGPLQPWALMIRLCVGHSCLGRCSKSTSSSNFGVALGVAPSLPMSCPHSAVWCGCPSCSEYSYIAFFLFLFLCRFPLGFAPVTPSVCEEAICG